MAFQKKVATEDAPKSKQVAKSAQSFRVNLFVMVEAPSADQAEEKVFAALYDLPWIKRVRSEREDRVK